MKTYFNNGENWFVDSRSLWKQLRQWIIWIGGWEMPGGEGWEFRYSFGERPWRTPTPISLFGDFITIYGFGINIQFKRGYLCFHRNSAYFSPDATPTGATYWLWNTPYDVQRKAAEHQADLVMSEARDDAAKAEK